MAQYEIVIRNQSSNEITSPISGEASLAPTLEQPAGDIGGNIGGSRGKAAAVISYATVKSFAQQILQHRVNSVELRTGSAELQQKISFAYQIGNQAFSLVESIAIGAAVGNLPGAVIGAITGITRQAINYAQNYYTIQWQGEVESIQNDLKDRRAGGQIQTYNGSRQSNQ